MYRLRCALTPQNTLRITREIGSKCGMSTHQAKRFYNGSVNVSSAFIINSACTLPHKKYSKSHHYSFRPVGYSLSFGPNIVQEAMRHYNTNNSRSAINKKDEMKRSMCNDTQSELYKHEELDKLLTECLQTLCTEASSSKISITKDNVQNIKSGSHSFLPYEEELHCNKQQQEKEENNMEMESNKKAEQHPSDNCNVGSSNKMFDRVFYFYPHKASLLERNKQLYAQIISPLQSALCMPQRGIRVRDKDDKEQWEKNEEKEQKQEEKEQESEKKQEESKAEEDAKDENAKSKQTGKKGKPRKSFADNIRGLKNDYAKFPDIYNGANAILFIIFTVFCLCSTGTNTEEEWWLQHWGLDNLFRPYNWLLHSFLTNNFLSMTYAMMVLHAMCYQMLPTLGSHNLILYTCATAVISGAIIWAYNRFRYGDGESMEKQFGPWDVVSAMFVMQYMYFGIGPIRTLNSFNS